MIHPFENIESLFSAPEVRETEKFLYPGIKQFFIKSVPFRGKTTEVFACCGLPENASRDNPVPAVVLVHGGGGTALANWVELWNKRGYAAISMDTCGCIPTWSISFARTVQSWMPHETGGPIGWGRFEAAAEPPEDQWGYHAVSAVIAAHSFLRSMPEVDPQRIGLTGISWGGVLSCIAAALDDRFSWVAPVYGCGFLNTPDSTLGYFHPDATDELRAKWCELWDPARYLNRINIPAFFLAGTNDAAFPLDSLQKSLALIRDVRSLLYVEYSHNHVISWEEETIFRFADAMSKGSALPRIGKIFQQDDCLVADLTDAPEPVSVTFNWTRGSGWWNGRKWESSTAEYCNGKISAPIAKFCNDRVAAPVPRCVSAAFFTVSFADGSSFSTPVWQAQPATEENRNF